MVTAVNGFLSAYFMEQPGFRVLRHFDELESGMHVWICEVPGTMKMTTLLRRLQADIPPCRYSQIQGAPTKRLQYARRYSRSTLTTRSVGGTPFLKASGRNSRVEYNAS